MIVEHHIQGSVIYRASLPDGSDTVKMHSRNAGEKYETQGTIHLAEMLIAEDPTVSEVLKRLHRMLLDTREHSAHPHV